MMFIMNKQDPHQTLTLENFLVQEMQKRGLSIVALARGAGIARQSLHAYFDGARPNLENCRKLAFFLGVSVGTIVGLAYPNVEDKIVDSLIEAYLGLPDEGRRVVEDVLFALQRHMGKS